MPATVFAGAFKNALLNQFYIFFKVHCGSKYNPKNNTGGAVFNNLMYVTVLVCSINTSPKITFYTISQIMKDCAVSIMKKCKKGFKKCFSIRHYCQRLEVWFG